MRLELRKRMHDDRVSYHHDVVLLAETDEESALLDYALGKHVDPDGLIAKFTGELRLSDGLGEHYLLVQPVQP